MIDNSIYFANNIIGLLRVSKNNENRKPFNIYELFDTYKLILQFSGENKISELYANNIIYASFSSLISVVNLRI